MNLQYFIDKIENIVPGELLIESAQKTATVKEEAVYSALTTYSGHRPRRMIQDFYGDGTKVYAIFTGYGIVSQTIDGTGDAEYQADSFAAWLKNYSVVTKTEYPVGTVSDAWIFEKNSLVFSQIPNIGEQFKIFYTALHPCTAQECIIESSVPALEWAGGFSRIDTVEYPVDDSDETVSVLEPDDDYLIRERPEADFFRFTNQAPDNDEQFRIRYTTLHICNDENCTVPEADAEAVASLAASHFLDSLSNYYAQSGDSVIRADSVDHKSKSQEYGIRAKVHRQMYYTHMKINKGELAPACDFQTWDTPSPGFFRRKV